MSHVETASPVPSSSVMVPAPLGRTLLLSVAALAAGIGAVRWIDPPATDVFMGSLEAHRVPLTAERDGRLVEVLAPTGTAVATGQPLFRLQDEQTQTALERTQQELAGLRLDLEQAEARAAVDLAWRMRELEQELHETRLKSASLLQAQFNGQLELRAWRESAGDGPQVKLESDTATRWTLVSGEEATSLADDRRPGLLRQESTRNAVEVASAQLELCEARSQEIEQLKSSLPAAVNRATGVERLKSREAALTHELETLDARATDTTVVAPEYGALGVYRHQMGDHVPAGTTIVELLDAQRRSVRVAVPSRRLIRFSADESVVLRFPGGEQRRGIVQSIPPQTTSGATSPADATAELLILPTGKLWPAAAIGTAIEVVPQTAK